MNEERKRHRIGTLIDAQETAIGALMLVARVRAAVGDPEGKLTRDELLDHCRTLTHTAQREKRLEIALRDAVSTYVGGDKIVTAERIEAWQEALR